MIRNLNFEVTFATTGKTFKGSHNFETGMTAITGRNEAGKSLRLEMIRYALFGNKALRSETKNYKSIQAELYFVINENEYHISRHNSKALLERGVETIATGTKPVNEAIIRIFGYDLEVFDVANACLQGEIEALTQKTPAERKRMVDRTIGLDALDDVISSVQDDIRLTSQSITMMETKVLENLIEPQHPQGDVPIDERADSETLEPFIGQLQEDLKNKNYYQGKLDNSFVKEPEAFTLTLDFTDTLEELQKQSTQIEVDNVNLEQLRSKLKSHQLIQMILKKNNTTVEEVRKYVEGDYENKWTAFKTYEAYKSPEPAYTKEELDSILNGFELDKQSMMHLHVACPECKHEFDVDRTSGIPENDNFDWTKYHSDRIKFGINFLDDIMQGYARLKTWAKFKSLDEVKQPDMVHLPNIAQLKTVLDLIEDLKDFIAVDAETKLLEGDKNYQAKKDAVLKKVLRLNEFTRVKETYERAIEKYKAYLLVKAELQPKIDALKDTEIKLNCVQTEYRLLKDYEEKKAVYDSKVEGQKKAIETYTELKTNLDILQRVKQGLSGLKPKVKMHLLPSLNSVSSMLISEMTNGERKSIVVGDDFDITVDGQPINTLSGSGKAVANLSVRIGLGTVLTNKVFSVFLADEIDSSMDADRAEYTAQSLANLTSTISQIILVSHKTPEADHQIIV